MDDMCNLALILGVGVVLRGQHEMLAGGFGHVAAGGVFLFALDDADKAADFVRVAGQSVRANGV